MTDMILNKIKLMGIFKKIENQKIENQRIENLILKIPKIPRIENNYSNKCDYYNKILWDLLIGSLNIKKTSFNKFDFSCYIGYYYSIDESDEIFKSLFNDHNDVNYMIFNDFLKTLNNTDYKEIINCIEYVNKMR